MPKVVATKAARILAAAGRRKIFARVTKGRTAQNGTGRGGGEEYIPGMSVRE
jgi:hypothetical protein